MALDPIGVRTEAVAMRQPYWIPGIFVAAMLFVVLVNGVMVYLATASFSGLDTAHAYQEGLEYDATRRAAARSAALGWIPVVEIAKGVSGRVVTVDLRDKSNAPVTGLKLKAYLVRPATSALDRSLLLDPVAAAPGRYAGSVDLPANGLWEVRLVGWRGAEIWQWADRRILP